MRNEARRDVWKVWLYAAAVVALGAWISPLIYNAGKALAEVTASGKSTNGLLDWLAESCRLANFPVFYKTGLWVAAGVLFFPWMEWIHARRGDAACGAGPWLLRLPDGARMTGRGQPLQRNLRGLWLCCAGFLVVSGLLLSMGVALVPAGVYTLRHPGGGMAELAVWTLVGSIIPAVAMEVFFRGITMGIFLRAMRPAAALGMSAAFFALALSAIPSPGLNVADSDAAGTGFEMLRLVVGRFADWRSICGNFAPLLALGAVLAYARWRTASLWLPIGLHTGWLFSKSMLDKLSEATGAHNPDLSINPLLQGLVPLIAIILAGMLAHYLTANHDDESAVRS